MNQVLIKSESSLKNVWINFNFNQLWISCESTFNGLNHFSIICKTSESLILLFESLLYLFQIAGELYTWGKGRYGRLGHGDSEDQTKPKLVEALLGCRVIDVACGKQDYGHIHLQYFPVNINIKLFFPSTSWRNKLTGKWSFGFIYFSVKLSQLFSLPKREDSALINICFE